MKWFLKLCLCLPLLAQAQTLTVKVPSRPINDLDKEYQLKLLELALTCLSLGFEGQYRSAPNGAKWRAKIIPPTTPGAPPTAS